MILDRDMTMYILHIIFFVSTTSKQSAKLVDLKWLPLRDASTSHGSSIVTDRVRKECYIDTKM